MGIAGAAVVEFDDVDAFLYELAREIGVHSMAADIFLADRIAKNDRFFIVGGRPRLIIDAVELALFAADIILFHDNSFMRFRVRV
jgi:hypothetical protein